MFPHLFVARPRSTGGEPVFSLNLLFDQAAQKTPEYQAIRQAIADAIDGEFGAGKSKDAVFCKTLRLPLRDCGEKTQYAGFKAGDKFINPWTKTKPGLVDGNLADIHAATDVFAGMLARCTMTAFAYNKAGNRGVNFMLNNVQIVNADMPRMDGRRSANSDFESVANTDSGLGPNDDDAAPF